MSRTLDFSTTLALIDQFTGPSDRITRGNKKLQKQISESANAMREMRKQGKQIDYMQDMQAQLGKTGTELDTTRRRISELAQQIKNTDNPTKKLTREFEQQQRRAAELSQRHRNLRTDIATTRTELRSAGVDTRSLANASSNLRTRMDAANRSIEEHRTALRNATRARERFNNAINSRNQMAGTGAGALASGGTALYGAGRAMMPGIGFEAEMANVGALARVKKGSDDYNDLVNKARELGSSTSYKASEVAQGQGFLAMAGFNKSAINESIGGILNMAKAGRTELAETANIGSNILSGFSLSADQMDRVGDVLVGTFTRSNVNLEMLGYTMSYAAAAAATAGGKLEEVSGMAGLLGNIGIQGSNAGTAIRSLYTRLAAPPKDARNSLKALNISTTDANGNLRAMPDILRDIGEATKTLPDAQQLEHFKSIGGQYAVSAIAELSKKAKSGELNKFINTLRNTNSEAATVAKEMADNTKGNIDTLGSSFESLNITLFNTSDGAINSVIKKATELTRGVDRWIQQNPKLAGTLFQIATAGAIVVATFGAITLGMAAMIGPFAVMRLGMTMLGIRSLGIAAGIGKIWMALKLVGTFARANPIGILVTALVTGAVLIYKNWDRVKAFFADIPAWLNTKMQQAKTFVGNAITGIKNLFFNFHPLGIIIKNWTPIMDYFGSLKSKFFGFGKDMLNGLIGGLKNKITAVIDTVSDIGNGAVNKFKDILGIRSPSRVMMQLGGHTTDGFAIGMRKRVNNVTTSAKKISGAATLAAGTALAGGAGMATAAPAIGNIEIHIHAQPGMDSNDIAQTVANELQKLQARQAAQHRSRNYD